MTMSQSLQQLAKEALEVQDACNLVAVAKCFAVVVSQVRAALNEAGLPSDSVAVNKHPIVRVYADKISHLTGRDADIIAAFNECHRIAEGGQP
jgi:Tfp pilus assembly PilM family ATPase